MNWNKNEVIERLQNKDWDKVFEIKQKQEKTIRSSAQNRYWHWVICSVISNWSWDSNISVHYMLKEMFNLETTTDLSTDEFAFMCKAVIELFKEKYWVTIPLPRDINEEQSLFRSLWF